MDFSSTARLSSGDALKIDELGEGVLNDYNVFIGEFIASNGLFGEKLFLAATCRNTLISNILHKFCQAALFEQKVIADDYMASVTVDDISMTGLFEQVLEKHGVDTVQVTHKWQLPIIFVGLFNLSKTLYIAANCFLWSRLFCIKRKEYGKIIYLDTFLFKCSLDNDAKFDDRYFTGHSVHLTKKEREMVHYVPTLFGVTHPWDYVRVMRGLKKTKDKFIVKERCLTFFDYLYAIVYSIIIPFSVKSVPTFRGYNVDRITRRAVLLDVASPSLFRALCQYRFVRRLSKRNEKVVGVVNWFENQVKDRALNLSFKKYYPDIVVKGYQGFMPIKYYASLQPQAYELSLGTLPDMVYVQNEETVSLYKETCPELSLKLAPAFRFKHLFDATVKLCNERKVVLIALPGAGFSNDIFEMLKCYLKVRDSFQGEVDAIIKVHPSCTKNEILELIPELGEENICFSEQSIPELLKISNVIISSASSVCMEAVALGIPVAIMGGRYGVTMNPVPERVNSEFCTVFFKSYDLGIFLRHALLRTTQIPQVERWFVRVDRCNTRELFLKY